MKAELCELSEVKFRAERTGDPLIDLELSAELT